MTVWANLEWERIVPENPNTILLRLSGALTSTPESYAFLEEVREDVSKNFTHVVVNLEKVERITSAGVGVLCAAYSSMKNCDGELILVGLSERNQVLIKAVGLWDQIKHFDGEGDVDFG